MLGSRNMSSLISVNPNIIKKLDLEEVFRNPQEFKNRIADYFLPSFGKHIITEITDKIINNQSGSFLIAGRPGFGKTHLLAYLAEFLTIAPNDKLMEEMAKSVDDFNLKELKEQIGRFLVVIPAFPKEGYQDLTVNRYLIGSLNGALMRESQELILEATDNAVEAYSQAARFLKDNGDIKGIAIVMDNLDPVVREMETDEKTNLTNQIEEFFRFLRSQEDIPIIFIGASSFIPSDYTTTGIEEDAIAQVGKKFDQVHWFSYLHEEWMEFTANTILQQSSPEAMMVLTSNPEFEKLAQFTAESGIMGNKDISYIQEEFLPKSFPLHPFTLYFLPLLSQKTSRSEKNLFSFFKDTSPGSFRYFLDTFGIVQVSGKLSVYTPDYLFSYYESTIKSSQHLKNIYDSVEKAYMLSGNMPLARRVIRLMALMQIIDDKVVRPTKRNLMESLHAPPKEIQKFDPLLIDMIQKGGFIFDRKTQEVSLPAEKTGIDLRRYINNKVETLKQTLDITQEINYEIKGLEIIPASYNSKHLTDRKSRSSFISINDLQNENFPSEIAKKLGLQNDIYMGDYHISYFLASEDEELDRAREIIQQSEAWKNDRLITAIPIRPAGFIPLLFEKAALMELRENDPPFNKPDSPERELLDTHLAEIIKELEERMTFFTRSDRLYWFHKGSQVNWMNQLSREEIIDKLLQEKYPQFPVIPEPALSYFKDKSAYRTLREEAVEKLLGNSNTIKIPKDSASMSDKLILKLAEGGIFSIHEDEDNYLCLESVRIIEGETPLQKIWNTLNEAFLPPRAKYVYGETADEVFRCLMQSPYGITPSLLEVMTAAVLGRYRGDLQFIEAAEEGKPAIVNYNAIKSFVSDPLKYNIKLIELDAEEKLFAAKIIEMIEGKDPGYSEAPLWQRGLQALVKWLEALPSLTKNALDFHGKSTREFILVLSDINDNITPEDFFKKHLPSIFGYDLDSFSYKTQAIDLLNQIKDALIEASHYSKHKKAALIKAAKLFFAGKSRTFAEVFPRWKAAAETVAGDSSLSPDAEALMKTSSDIDLDNFVEEMPDKFGMKPFSQWEYDGTMEFLARLSRAKLEIELADMSRILAYPEEKEPKLEIAKKTMEFVFEKFGVDKEHKEVYIIDLMEKCVWE